MKFNLVNIIGILILCSCSTITVPPDFTYKQLDLKDFTLASWQKITDSQGLYKIYIEGDGYAFNARGRATADPTPHSTMVRNLAFSDPNPNVIYLARPCQYIKSGICSQRHWTTARFSPEIVNAEYEAIKQIAKDNPVVLIGFSGGAQIAGLVSVAKKGLNIKKVITIAGNLDHLAWTTYHKLDPLDESMNLADYQKEFAELPQIHYVGGKDKNILPFLVKQFVKDEELVVLVPNAEHNRGWNDIFPEIHQQN